MLTLEPGAATSLQGGMRPRTTLTPTVAVNTDGSQPGFGLAFGSPGGDGARASSPRAPSCCKPRMLPPMG